MPDIGPKSKHNRIDVAVPTRTNAPRRPTRQCAVLGAGGHGRELADIIRAVGEVDGETELLGIADDGEPDRFLLARSGIRFLGSSDMLVNRPIEIFLGIGYPAARREAAKRLHATSPARALIHPSAVVGTSVAFGSGAVVAQGAVLTTNVSIGEHSHVNVKATVSHDCAIGDFVTISPGATITGAVRVGNDVFIGAGATILPGVSIGQGAIVGAGAVVVKDVPPHTTVAGVPARPLS